jgi:hypothetical protein
MATISRFAAGVKEDVTEAPYGLRGITGSTDEVFLANQPLSDSATNRFHNLIDLRRAIASLMCSSAAVVEI